MIDLAAGTGNLAGHLARRTMQVMAVDIDRRMLVALGHRLPGVAVSPPAVRNSRFSRDRPAPWSSLRRGTGWTRDEPGRK